MSPAGDPPYFKIENESVVMSSLGDVSVFTWLNSPADVWSDLNPGGLLVGIIKLEPDAAFALLTPSPSCGHLTANQGSVLVNGMPIEAKSSFAFVAPVIAGVTFMLNES